MNKIILYVGLAILLGTVTMVAPLALLQDDSMFSDGSYTLKSLDTANETRGNFQTSSQELPSDMLGAPEPNKVETTGLSTPEEPEIWGLFGSDSGTDLSPIVLITVPSFLVALGVFVFLRKQG
ncbi:MAG: hypothetical protein IAX21_07875 [Candidatus Bathyarchaeota archaeon]|nr:hypothetical protein [Candidatus Bathyarchaeum tardum]WGM89191.1 MAG: hypothetical protein NUK63_09810 [Candidatus Bathyarchaeum tardum]WNZ28570.1 MAG: hypothetical protein IAX21_07875 [Candidatus Bathyarchaeota archaeon]